jgi:hypothetical protein
VQPCARGVLDAPPQESTKNRELTDFARVSAAAPMRNRLPIRNIQRTSSDPSMVTQAKRTDRRRTGVAPQPCIQRQGQRQGQRQEQRQQAAPGPERSRGPDTAIGHGHGRGRCGETAVVPEPPFLRDTGLPSRSALVAPPLRLAAQRWRAAFFMLVRSRPPPGVSTACLEAVARFSEARSPRVPPLRMCPSMLEASAAHSQGLHARRYAPVGSPRRACGSRAPLKENQPASDR